MSEGIVKVGMTVAYRDDRGYWHNAEIVAVTDQDTVDLRVPHVTNGGPPLLVEDVVRQTALTEVEVFKQVW